MCVYVSDLSTDSLKYLSSEQALADLAYFRWYMSDKLKLSKNKWIAFGGSYPGMYKTAFGIPELEPSLRVTGPQF